MSDIQEGPPPEQTPSGHGATDDDPRLADIDLQSAEKRWPHSGPGIASLAFSVIAMTALFATFVIVMKELADWDDDDDTAKFEILGIATLSCAILSFILSFVLGCIGLARRERKTTLAAIGASISLSWLLMRLCLWGMFH